MGRLSEQLVILTFDDGVKNHLTFVAPLLKRMGFSGTFFVSDDPYFQGGEHHLTWDEAREIADMGFEIGTIWADTSMSPASQEKSFANWSYRWRSSVKNRE